MLYYLSLVLALVVAGRGIQQLQQFEKLGALVVEWRLPPVFNDQLGDQDRDLAVGMLMLNLENVFYQRQQDKAIGRDRKISFGTALPVCSIGRARLRCHISATSSQHSSASTGTASTWSLSFIAKGSPFSVIPDQRSSGTMTRGSGQIATPFVQNHVPLNKYQMVEHFQTAVALTMARAGFAFLPYWAKNSCSRRCRFASSEFFDPTT